MVLNIRKPEGEIVGEGIDFARNVLVVGTCHFLNPAEKARIEAHVSEVDFVCIEWDQIRDNDAKGRPGGRRDYFHSTFDRTSLDGDHLYANVGDVMRYDNFKEAMMDAMTANARENSAIAACDAREGNEFLFIQDICERQGKDCYFVDKLTSHTRYRIMCMARVLDISAAFDLEARDRSRYMEAETLRTAQERFSTIGRQEQCALFVGAGHLKDFPDWRFRKDNPDEPKN